MSYQCRIALVCISVLFFGVYCTAEGQTSAPIVTDISVQDVRVREGKDIKFILKLNTAVGQPFVVAASFADITAVWSIPNIKPQKDLGDYNGSPQIIPFNGIEGETHELDCPNLY